MGRVLTESHKRKLARGRDAARRARHKRDVAAAAEYREWLKHESLAYEDLLTARSVYGDDSWDAKEAYANWYAILGDNPIQTLPSDSVLRAIRGEIGDE